ncbi:ABC transporter ATP-binding protein [Bdellovibrio bacteriovorus]|uniref:ABC transporter, ATP-binding protein n=1 Tax=Bdellovibrio bacteriovorus str. Tiberius TaxID=1069642 RepID=K7ZBZ9_BDEBC|nr:ABC transporter ATP-binding protein [Bdellovibrio bacteriovorus]AFY02769.1 ABC transporter, ATP-binding protein [Bdellovibrio bacteriovorus str. Tiberius]
MSALYRLKGLEYSYLWNGKQVPVLKGIDLELEKGCFTCIVGPSGTGKTTLLNLLGLIDTPSNGHLEFAGEDVTHLPESEKENVRLHKVGFIFQSFYLIPTLTVLENTSYFLPSLGYNHANAHKVAMETLDLLGLADHAKKKPLELSGGQRQRVAIARAIAKKPAVVLADEPTANLDSVTAEKTINAFKELQKSENTSFIFSTHDSHLVSFAKSVYRMKDGMIDNTKSQGDK